MKKPLLITLMALAAVGAFAQGTINYNTRVVGIVVAPIYAPEAPGVGYISKTGNTSAGFPAGTQTYAGAPLNGSNFRAELFYSVGGGALETALQGSAASITTFRTSASLAGTIAPLSLTLTGVPVGSTITAQLRVWDNTSGLYPDWASAEVAWNADLIAAGKSGLFDIANLTDSTNPAPPEMTGMRSFNIYYINIPEPSTFVLAGLGAAGLLIFRRRK